MHNRSRHDATFTAGSDRLSGLKLKAQRSLKSVLMVGKCALQVSQRR